MRPAALSLLILFAACSAPEDELAEKEAGLGFAASSAAVLMTDYWPVRGLSRLYRVPGGRIYYRQVIVPQDPTEHDAAPSSLSARPGTVAYLLHDYFDYEGSNVAAPFWGDTWHLRNTPSTGEVSEVADTFPLRNATDTADLRTCLSPCYGRRAVYNHGPIGHGRPGGHRVGEAPYLREDIDWWYSAAGVAPYAQLDARYGSWSALTLLEKLDTYTPPFGRDAQGQFGPGRAPTYSRVVKVLFAHGNKVATADEPRCSNQPAAYPHRAGMSSFWQVLWLAPDVGIIQFENLFYEPACDGTALHAGEGAAGAWNAYLDELVELGPSAPTCTPLADQVVTNTCASVGYPQGFVGSYVSRRSYDCALRDYGPWERVDSCRAPVCTPLADQVVIDTCPGVGYPAGWVGSYVSRRTWDCATGDYGAWSREDSCRAP